MENVKTHDTLIFMPHEKMFFKEREETRVMNLILSKLKNLIFLYPKTFSGLWFATFGFLATAGLFLFAASSRGINTIFLYLGLPIICAGISGYILGFKCIDPNKKSIKAMFQGMLVSLFAFLIFTPIFASLDVIFPSHGNSTLLSLILGIFLYGFMATGPIILIFGGIAGFLLHKISTILFKKFHASPHEN